MISFFKNIFLSQNEKELKKINKVVQAVNEWDFSPMSDDDIKRQTFRLKELHAKGKSLNQILPEAFATVKEASKRVLGKTHYDVQLIGGVALHEGNVAEMKTGEGKTLVATLPAYLNSLTGKSVHIVTVNEYLAKRDYEELSPLYSFLGVTSSFVHSDMTQEQKKEAYKASIIFGTNNEFGFDYLRDNMVRGIEQRVQSELHYAIVDEVDSILIDESRTPLVISGPSSDANNVFKSTNALVKLFKKEIDYEIDEETQQCYLTDDGINKSEKFFNIENLYSPEYTKLNHFITQSLKAHTLMKKDKDYIVLDGEVHIIDQFTGRVSKGRRYSNGLHQAIEIKENVEMKEETVTKATITYQNYFRMYNKLSGMTGTAATEQEELRQVYGLETVVIPTNKPIQRNDLSDLIFVSKKEKINAIVSKVKELNALGQPVLVGTGTIEESEEFSSAFTKNNINHHVLNAKNHEREADIISEAGQQNAVTIATNMAGRGTDIKLGATVSELGGLYIIGTSKNENRRIDNQLRGRSGRQGDPGVSQFYISLEDDLMIRFGASKVKENLKRLKLEGEGLSSKFLTNVFENAQKQLEGSNYDARKRLLQYDNVLNIQRELIYKERAKLLQKHDISNTVDNFVDEVVSKTISNFNENNLLPDEWDFDKLNNALANLIRKELPKPNKIEDKEEGDIILYYTNLFKKELQNKKESLPKEIVEDLFKNTFLSIIDSLWEQHLESLNEIRQGIHLRAYGQNDPLREYEFVASEAFEDMLYLMKYNVLLYLYSVEINKEII